METDVFIYVSARRDLEENGWVLHRRWRGFEDPAARLLRREWGRRAPTVACLWGPGGGLRPHHLFPPSAGKAHAARPPDPESSGRELVTRALLYDKDTFRFWGGDREMTAFPVRAAHRATCGPQGRAPLRGVGAAGTWEFQAVRVAKPVGFLGNERLVNQAKGPQGVKPCLSHV